LKYDLTHLTHCVVVSKTACYFYRFLVNLNYCLIQQNIIFVFTDYEKADHFDLSRGSEKDGRSLSGKKLKIYFILILATLKTKLVMMFKTAHTIFLVI
jgi:hypothetical protein